LNEFLPETGYEGSEEAVRSYHTTTIWQGEDTNTLPQAELEYNAETFEEDSEEDIFGGGKDQSGFDPVFEVGAEIDEHCPGLGGEE
jgi:hypothetical protein